MQITPLSTDLSASRAGRRASKIHHDPALDGDLRVHAYWNINASIWSLRAVSGHHRGRVIAHAASFSLLDCTFRVSEAGRQRVIREKCRNVHAWIVGTLQSVDATPTSLLASIPGHPLCPSDGDRFTYNPYRSAFFHLASPEMTAIHSAGRVVANGRRIVASGHGTPIG